MSDEPAAYEILRHQYVQDFFRGRIVIDLSAVSIVDISFDVFFFNGKKFDHDRLVHGRGVHARENDVHLVHEIAVV